MFGVIMVGFLLSLNIKITHWFKNNRLMSFPVYCMYYLYVLRVVMLQILKILLMVMTMGNCTFTIVKTYQWNILIIPIKVFFLFYH